MKYTISEFAAATGLSVDTLRYYEKENLICPRRDASGCRQYTGEDLAWAEFLLRLRDTGMPIREIARYAFLRAQGEDTLQERLLMLREHEARLKKKVEEQVQHLQALRRKIAWYEEQVQQKPLPAASDPSDDLEGSPVH